MTQEKDEPRMIVHVEGELGSSTFDIAIQNADAAQLFAIAGIIHSNAQIALAAQMQQSARGQKHIVVPGGRLD